MDICLILAQGMENGQVTITIGAGALGIAGGIAGKILLDRKKANGNGERKFVTREVCELARQNLSEKLDGVSRDVKEIRRFLMERYDGKRGD